MLILILSRLVGVGEASFISLAAPFIDDNAPIAQVSLFLYSLITVGMLGLCVLNLMADLWFLVWNIETNRGCTCPLSTVLIWVFVFVLSILVSSKLLVKVHIKVSWISLAVV